MSPSIRRALVAGLAATVLTTASVADQVNTQAPSVSASPVAPAPATFNAEAATVAYLATLSSQARARSDAYFEGGYWLVLWDLAIGIFIALLLLNTRLSARMRDLAARITRFKALQNALYALQYVLITSIIQLPWAAYEGYFREHQYGMSNQDLPAWLGDQLKGLLIGLVFASLGAMAIYAVIRKAPKTWWLWGSLVALAFVVFQIMLSPTLLEPVFNKFYPLADSPLKQEILSLARANGIPADQVYEFDASKQTTKISAHVSGIFGTAQISLNDNLVNRSSPEEIKAVLGHEMGHYVLNHIYKALLSISLIIVIGLALLGWAFDKVVLRYGARWGIESVSDVAGLPLLALLFSIYIFVLTPLLNTVTRTMEAEADAFGLNASRQPDGFAQAAVHLSEYRKMQPGPIEEFVFFDHPSGSNRIHRAMVWKAENINTPDIKLYDATHSPPAAAK